MSEEAKNGNQSERDGDELFNAAEVIFVDSLASGMTIADSAAKAGFSYMTGRRYHKRPEIRAAVRERSKEAIQAGARVLSQRSHAAAKALADMAEGQDDANPARVSACKAVLEIGLKVVEIDGMQERLEAVEAQLAASAKGTT